MIHFVDIKGILCTICANDDVINSFMSFALLTPVDSK